MKEDRINPSYYQKGICSCGNKLQTYDFVREMPYPDASAIKYIVRHREKNGAEDIKKAIDGEGDERKQHHMQRRSQVARTEVDVKTAFLNCLQKRSEDEWLPVKRLSSTNTIIMISSSTLVQRTSPHTSTRITTTMSMTTTTNMTTICANTVSESHCERQRQRCPS